MSDRPSGILFVCTGNVCRSPYMEFRLRAMLEAASAGPLTVSSAGTRALEGHPMADTLRQRLGSQGIDASDFRARRLTADALHAAALVVTATREHRHHVVRDGGSDLAERTFTLAQLARLLGAADSSGRENAASAGAVGDLVSDALSARGRGWGGALGDDDLDDPWQRSRRRYRRVAERIDQLLIPIAERLTARG